MVKISYEELEKKYGKIVTKWTFPEFTKVYKGDSWWIILGLIGGVFLVYSVLTFNFLFSIAIILIYFIIFTHQSYNPREIEFIITELGVIIDDTFYPYHEIKQYWILYNPPEVKYLYLDIKKFISPVRRIPLQDINPLFVREVLSKYLFEELSPDDEPFSDALGRALKL